MEDKYSIYRVMENSCLKQCSSENITMLNTLLASEEGYNFQQIGI